jgi:hypothetical protein
MMGGRSECTMVLGSKEVRANVSRYIRSHIPLDDLERMARYPAVDKYGRETGNVVTVDQAGSHGQ